MSAETDVYAVLSSGSPSLVAGKIYPDSIPLGISPPVVLYRRTGTNPVLVLNGSTDAAQAIIEIDCWADTRAEAEAIANNINQLMIAASHMPVERQGLQDDETGLFAVTQSFSVWEV